MFPTRLTQRRSAIGFWPFTVPGTTPPTDPLSCLAQWPNTTWNASTNQCVSLTDPGSAGSTALQYMMLACKALPSCYWDTNKSICSCASKSGISPDAPSTPGTCPEGSYQIPAGVPGAGTCIPVSAPGLPQIPGVQYPAGTGQQPATTPTVSGQATVGGQQVTVSEQSWWSKQTDTTKALVIGGGALAALGLVLLATSGKGKGPAIVYTSGQPMRANKKRRRNEFWFLSDGRELGEKEMWDAVDSGGFVYVMKTSPSGSARWSVYHGRPHKEKLGRTYLPAVMHKSLSAGDVPKKVLSAAGR